MMASFLVKLKDLGVTRLTPVLMLLTWGTLTIIQGALDATHFSQFMSFWSATRFSYLLNGWYWFIAIVFFLIWPIFSRKPRVQKMLIGVLGIFLIVYAGWNSLRMASVYTHLDLAQVLSPAEILIGTRTDVLELMLARLSISSIQEFATLEQRHVLIPTLSRGLLSLLFTTLGWIYLAKRSKNNQLKGLYLVIGLLAILLPVSKVLDSALIALLIGLCINQKSSNQTKALLSINNRHRSIITGVTTLLSLPLLYSATAVSPQLLLLLPGPHRVLYTEEQILELSLEIEPEWGAVHRFAADRTLLWIRSITSEHADQSINQDQDEQLIATKTAEHLMKSLDYSRKTSQSEIPMIGLLQLSARYRLLSTANTDAISWYRATLLAMLQHNPRFGPAYDQLAETYKNENPDHAQQILNQKTLTIPEKIEKME